MNTTAEIYKHCTLLHIIALGKVMHVLLPHEQSRHNKMGSDAIAMGMIVDSFLSFALIMTLFITRHMLDTCMVLQSHDAVVHSGRMMRAHRSQTKS